MVTEIKYLKNQQDYVLENLKNFTDNALLDMFYAYYHEYETAIWMSYYDDIDKEAIDTMKETYHIIRNELLRRMSKQSQEV